MSNFPATSSLTLFGADIYRTDKKTASGLETDIKLIPHIKKTWVPSVGPGLLNDTPVGTYDCDRAHVTLMESSMWAGTLKDFPNIPLAADAPARLGFAPRATVFLRAMQDVFPVPDTPFWNSAAEQAYGYVWATQDNILQCTECLKGACAMSVFATFPDYYHFLEKLTDILDVSAQSVVDYIEHVQQKHEAGGPESKLMDAWLMTTQCLYLDILHPKSDGRMVFPSHELNSIRYRLINGGVRALILQARLEQEPLVQDDDIIDACAFALLAMHDTCDCRHDNKAHEFYNIFTIVSGHTGKESVDVIRRFCIDVWAWAIDNRAEWAIRVAGRLLAWQFYMFRYQTSILLDNLTAPEPSSRTSVDPYGDSALNKINPLPRSADPHNLNLRDRCEDKAHYDQLLRSCLQHFRDCDSCRDYRGATWQNRVPILGAAYEKKYTDMSCLDTISTWMIIDPTALEAVWWAPDPQAKYLGPMGEWSSMLC